MIIWGKADELIFLQFGKKIFSKLTGALDNFCKVNSGSAFCEKLCEQTSVDPNVKFGPGNNGNLKHVNFLTNYGYTIFFENLATATAPQLMWKLPIRWIRQKWISPLFR
ncbi:MAG: hypothetical protein IPL50_04505 [Chitinophagaceae bacterium]|nr:hypothetical protein [Chitinophagaceae bacterium]